MVGESTLIGSPNIDRSPNHRIDDVAVAELDEPLGEWLLEQTRCRLTVGRPDHGGEGWVTRADLLDGDAAGLRGMFGQVVSGEGIPERSAATLLVEWTGGRVAEVLSRALDVWGVGIIVDPAGVRWHRHERGWTDGADIGEPAAVVVPVGHPWAARPDVEVAPDIASVAQRAVDALVDLCGPLVEAAASLTRVGRAGLWNEVGDGLGIALGYDETLPVRAEVRDRAMAAAGVAHRPWLAAPTVRIVDTTHGSTYVVQKAGCCLIYTRQSRAQDADVDRPSRPEYCSTCSLLDEADCEAQQRAWFEDLYAAGR